MAFTHTAECLRLLVIGSRRSWLLAVGGTVADALANAGRPPPGSP
jgi:hypothetical protein